MDLARALAPECALDIVGIRPGEKLHEVMIPEDDARNCLEFDTYYAVLPATGEGNVEGLRQRGGVPCPDGFRYSSDRNTHWLTVSELRKMIGLVETETHPGEGRAAA
jgi:UDP-N-acetylglucosamine 4,6-dehydratase